MAKRPTINLPSGLAGMSAGDLLRALGAEDWLGAGRTGGGKLTQLFEQLTQDQQTGDGTELPAGEGEDDAGTSRRGLSGSDGLTGSSSGSFSSPFELSALAPPFTDGDDHYFGGSGIDNVDALSGADTLFGNSAADTLSGASGTDQHFGGTGADVILTGAGNDYAEGGNGADVIYGGAPNVVFVTGDIRVNAANNLLEQRPFVTNLTDGSGGFIVGFERSASATVGPAVTALFRRFEADGDPAAAEVIFDNLVQTAGQAKGEIEIVGLKGANAGQYVVVSFSYENPPDDPDLAGGADVHSAFMRRYDAAGNQIGTTVELNTFIYTTSRPSVTALDDGSWVVVWQDQFRDTNGVEEGWGIYGQHYRVAPGNPNLMIPVGTDFHVSQSVAVNQALPRTATLANGNVVVMWNDDSTEGSDNLGVYYRVLNPDETFAAAPSFVTNQLRANSTVTLDQLSDAQGLTALRNGGFVITWYGNGTDAETGTADNQGVFYQVFNNAGQRLDADGSVVVSALVSTERIANTTTSQSQVNPAITYLKDGGFFIVWSQLNAAGDPSSQGLMGQRFDASGAKVGQPFLINQNTTGEQHQPNLTTLADGTVVVSWSGADTGGGTDPEVYVRLLRFGSSGGDDTLHGNADNDQLYGEDGNDLLLGGASIDVVDGGAGNDLLYGGGGGDSLYGGADRDTLEGEGAADLIIGGAGGDFASYALSTAAVTVNLSDLSAESGGHAEGDQLATIEHVIGSSFNDTLTGRLDPEIIATPDPPANNSLIGLDGDDRLFGLSGLDYLRGDSGEDFLQGGSGADTIIGGAGLSDTASYEDSNAGVTIDLSSGALGVGGTAQGDFLTEVENLIGSQHADTLIGQGGATIGSLYGGDGNDVLDGRQLGDFLHGGAGIDWVWYNTSGNAVRVDLGDGLAESGGQANGDILTAIENVLGSSLDDTLRGDQGVNVLLAGSGDDTLRGSTGADTMDGGVGSDTADYQGFGFAVNINLGTDLESNFGTTLLNIEHATGSSFADVIRGDSEANTIRGGDGDDVLHGQGGGDVLIGGTGLDWAAYNASAAAVQVTLGLSGTQTGTPGGDQIGDSLTEIEAVRGSAHADTLRSLLGAAIIDGIGGDDLLIGDAGTASYSGGAGLDTVDYRDSTGAVDVNLANGLGSGSYAAGDLYSGVENVLGSSFSDVVTGSSAVNTLSGFFGDDVLIGGSAADTLQGGRDNDSLTGGSGADLVDGGAGSEDYALYLLSTAGVQVNLSDALTETGGDAQGDSLIGIEHLRGSAFADQLTGDANVNRLYGEAGNDRLNGGSGADLLFGGVGDDAIFFDAVDSAVIGGTGRDTLVGTAGTDAVQMNAARFTFAGEFAAFELFDLGDGNDFYNGSTNAADFASILGAGITVFGGSGNDALNMRGNGAVTGINDLADGGAGNDNLWGGTGLDQLIGGNGDDALYGGSGSDVISGGAGFDVTYVGRDEGNDVINDSEGLVLFWGNNHGSGFYNGVDPTEIAIEYTGDEVVISMLDEGNAVTNTVRFGKGDVQVINLFDFGNGDAGNGASPPPSYARDIWSASWDSGTQTFTAFTKVVDG